MRKRLSSLSSTIRIVRPSFITLWRRTQLKPEKAPSARSRYNSRPSPHTFYSLLDDGQAKTCALVLFSVQTSEQPKNFRLMFKCDAGAFVFYPDANETRFLLSAQSHQRRHARRNKF